MLLRKIAMTLWLSISRHKHMKSVMGWTWAEVTGWKCGGPMWLVSVETKLTPGLASRPQLHKHPTPRWSSRFPIKPASASSARQNIQNKAKTRSQDQVLLLPTKTSSLEILPLRPLGGTLKGSLWLILLTHTYVTLYQRCIMHASFILPITSLIECVLISDGI